MRHFTLALILTLSACAHRPIGPILMNGNDIIHTKVQQNGPYHTIEKRVFTTIELAEIDFTAFLTKATKDHAIELCQGDQNILDWVVETRDFINLKHGASHWELVHQKKNLQSYPSGTVATASFRCRYLDQEAINKVLSDDKTEITLRTEESPNQHHMVTHSIRYTAVQEVNDVKVWLEQGIQDQANSLCGKNTPVKFFVKQDRKTHTTRQKPDYQETYWVTLTAEVFCP
ncbi:hypothetical protein [Marinicella meishanensis]|uniref:hypothetical protein n=1 Tax=Marinicella meishanensis TaxID=2873263 RepID=UPI001CBE2B44|nr:hypothetical protein [Marinicella sp. NBU2979]